MNWRRVLQRNEITELWPSNYYISTTEFSSRIWNKCPGTSA